MKKAMPSFENDEQVAEALRHEAVRLGLTLDEMLHPIKAAKLVQGRKSAVLAAAFAYFDKKGQSPR